MWSVNGKYLARQDRDKSTFNRVLGRSEPKPSLESKDSWLAGKQGVSKKVFSFKKPARTFGFVRHESDLAQMRETLRQVWRLSPSSEDWFISGDKIVDRLCCATGFAK